MQQARTRSFLALRPSEGQRVQLARQAQARVKGRAGRVVPAANIHLTLAFLGPQPEATLSQLMHQLDRVELPCFDLCLDTPRWRARAGLLWCEPKSLPAELIQLHGALQRCLLEVGLTPEPRPFRPHVTLARRLTGAPRTLPWEPPHWRVAAFSLMGSQTLPGGAVYHSLGQWSLGEGEG